MKKIILILFLFLIPISCYIIYNLTENKKTYILSLGDILSQNKYIINQNIKEYNSIYTDKEYRIIDLLNIIKYNQEKEINNKNVSIHLLLKKADIVILSVGMNDIYAKLNDNTKNIYTYINDMVDNMNQLLDEIDRYNYKEVIVLGYYNIENNNNDIFTYLNYKMKKITTKKKYKYIDLNKILKNNEKYLEKRGNYQLNEAGYKKINKIIVENLKKS